MPLDQAVQEKPSPAQIADDMHEDGVYQGRNFRFELVSNPREVADLADEMSMQDLADPEEARDNAPALFIWNKDGFLGVGSRKLGFQDAKRRKLTAPSRDFIRDLQAFESETGNTGWTKLAGSA